MPDGTIAPPSTSSPVAPSRTGGWIQQHRGIAIGGGIAVVSLLGYLYYRHEQSANAAAAAAATSSTGSATSAPTPGSYDTTGYGYYPYTGGYGGTTDMSTLQSELTALESQVAANSATGSTAAPTQTLTGSGYGAGNETPIQGTYNGAQHTFEWLANPQVAAALPANTPKFFQPAPGVFDLIASGVKLSPGTPQYIEVS